MWTTVTPPAWPCPSSRWTRTRTWPGCTSGACLHARTLPPRNKRKACDAACRGPGVGLRRECCRPALPHHQHPCCDVAVHPPRRPANDAFERRQTVPTVPAVLFGDTALCTLQPGEPLGLGASAGPGTKGAVGASLWFEVAGQTAGVRLRLSTAGSDFDTVMAVYTGRCGAGGRESHRDRLGERVVCGMGGGGVFEPAAFTEATIAALPPLQLPVVVTSLHHQRMHETCVVCACARACGA